MKYLYITLASLLFVLLVFGSAQAQEHKFWDAQSKYLVPSYLALTGADAYATDQLYHMTWHTELNPIMPSARSGQIAYFAGTAACVLGASYLAHKTGHHKLAHAILWVGTITEAQASTRSLYHAVP